MSPVTLYSNWCYHDRLDEADLQDGERLRIRWQDGSESEEVVRVGQGWDSVNDHGNACPVSVRRAFVERRINGQVVRLYLRPTDAPAVYAERVPSPDAWWDAQQ